MSKGHAIVILVSIAFLSGGWREAQQYLYELTLPEGHGRQVAGPVIVYTTQWCPYCMKARSYLNRHRFHYVEYDIEASAENREKFRELRGRAVPLIIVGDRRMHGFSPQSFEALLR